MTVKRDPDAILAAWLEEGPLALPEPTRRAIAVTTRTTRQGRRLLWVPRRFHMMNPSQRLALAVATIVVAAVGGLSLIGLTQQSGIGGPPSPTPELSPSPAGGTIALTDSGCTWESNPGAMTMPETVRIHFRNETDSHGAFVLHWVKPEHTYAEGVEYIADVQRRLTTGEDWPPNDISLAVENADVSAGDDTTIEWTTAGIGEGPLEEFRTGPNWRWEAGTYGVICSANTSPTGDILTTFLVGPLELSEVIASPEPSASR